MWHRSNQFTGVNNYAGVMAQNRINIVCLSRSRGERIQSKHSEKGDMTELSPSKHCFSCDGLWGKKGIV